jgi:hypothetical protein
MAAPPSAPSLGGLPDVGGGLSGLGKQLADTFGSLLGSGDGALADSAGIDEPVDDVDDVDDKLDDDPGDDEESVEPAADPKGEPAAEEPVEAPVVEEPVVESADGCEQAGPPAPADPQPSEPAPTPVPVPPPPEPATPPSAEAVAETPCEIAADELPQVGG